MVAILLILGSAILFSFKVILIKLAFRYGADTISILLLRLLFALPFYVLILAYVQQTKHRYWPNHNTWRWLVFLSFIGFYFSSFLDFYGLNYLPAGIERIIIFSTPAIVLLLSFLIYKTKVTKPQIFSAVVCYIGIVIAFLNQDTLTGGKNMMLGALLVLTSAVSYSLYLIFSERVLQRIPTVFFTCSVMIMSTIFVIVHYLIVYDIDDVFSFHRNVYLCGFAMAVFSTVLPTFMMSEGIKRIGAGNSAIFGGIGPISTIILAAVILDEHFSFLQYVGSALVIYGVYILSVNTKKRKQKLKPS